MRSDRERLLDILEAIEKIEARKPAQKINVNLPELKNQVLSILRELG